MFRSQQAEESYPEHSSMKRELERAQREQDKANLDRDQAKLVRDQAILEQEREQEKRLQKNVASSDRIKSETERLQRRQQAVASSKEKLRTPPEPVPSVRNLEANRIRPLMDIALPRLTSSSTSGSQSGTGTSRLRELQDRLQVKALENAAREKRPTT